MPKDYVIGRATVTNPEAWAQYAAKAERGDQEIRRQPDRARRASRDHRGPGCRPQRRHRVRELRGRQGLRPFAGVRGGQEAATGRRHARLRRRRGSRPDLAGAAGNQGRAPPWRATVLTLVSRVVSGAARCIAGGRSARAKVCGRSRPSASATSALAGIGPWTIRRPAAAPAWSCAPMSLGPPSMRRASGNPEAPRIYLSPRGELLTQAIVRELAAAPGVLLLAGRFEGIDERVIAGARLARDLDRRLCAGWRRGRGVGADRGRGAPASRRRRQARRRSTRRASRRACWNIRSIRARANGRARDPRRAALRRPQKDRRVAARGSRAFHARASAGPLAARTSRKDK